jgi:hypothetical protein
VLGLAADAISYVKMCALSALCALTVPLLSFQRGGSVRLKCLMRHKPPSFELKGDGTAAFQVVPHGGAGVLRLWCQVVKDLSMVRARLGALLLIAQSSAHSAASSLGVGIQSGKRGQSVLSNEEQLTMADK